jgi:hypothetical protein
MDPALTKLYIAIVVVVALGIVVSIAYIVVKSRGRILRILAGLLALVAGGAYERDKVIGAALLAVAMVLIIVDVMKSDRKQTNHTSDEM